MTTRLTVLAILTLAAGAAACTRSPVNVPAAPVVAVHDSSVRVPFEANSMTGNFNIRGEFAGEAVVRADSVHVVIWRARVAIDKVPQADLRGLTLKTAIGYWQDSATWNLGQRSKSVALAPYIPTSADTLLLRNGIAIRDTLRFVTPRNPSIPLRSSWIVFEFERPAMLGHSRSFATTYVHSKGLPFLHLQQ